LSQLRPRIRPLDTLKNTKVNDPAHVGKHTLLEHIS
jgi:hypothetical protein